MNRNRMEDEWLTLQAALAFGGFLDAAETERVALWAAEEIESLRQALNALRAHVQTVEAATIIHRALNPQPR